jgi:xanthine/uracil permease
MSLIPLYLLGVAGIMLVIVIIINVPNSPAVKSVGFFLALAFNWCIFYYVQLIPIDMVISYGILALLTIMKPKVVIKKN